MEARQVALRCLRRIDTESAFARDVVAKEAKSLSARDRALANELVYGVLRHRSRLDRTLAAAATRGLQGVSGKILTLLRLGCYQLIMLDRVPEHAAVNETVAAARKVGGSRMAGFVNGVLRTIARQGEPEWSKKDSDEQLAMRYSLPAWLVRELRGQLGQEADAGAGGLCAVAPMFGRVQTQQIDRARLMSLLAKEESSPKVTSVSWCPEAIRVDGLGDPHKSDSFLRGLWTVQDVSSQLMGHLVGDVPSGGRILDACSGVGGKATHLAQRLGDRACVDAVDASASRLAAAREAAQRLGLGSVHTICGDLVSVCRDLRGDYDAVMLDAPCSGMGVLRRHPEAKWRVTPADRDSLAAQQGLFLNAVASQVRPGGVLVYSVCTFTKVEGQDQIDAFLQRWPEFVVEDPRQDECAQVSWSKLTDVNGHVRTWPHLHGGDAFFGVRLRRRGTTKADP